MSFSYDYSDLSNDLNHLRFLVQDTEETGHFFEDEEIIFVSTQETGIYRVAARLCRTAAAKLGKQPSFDNEAIKYEANEKSKIFLNLAKEYDRKADELDESLKNAGSGSSGLNLPKPPCPKKAFSRDLHQ